MNNTILIKRVLLNGKRQDILIDGNKIVKIDADIDRWSADKTIDGDKFAAIPGLVNGHTHAAMTLVRGYKEDMALHEWLNEIWRIEAEIDDEMVYWGTKLACLEMIKTGTTLFNDQYMRMLSSVKAIEEMGLRSHQTFLMMNFMDDTSNDRLKRECADALDISGDWPDRIKFGVSVHSPYTVSEEMIRWSGEFVRENNLLMHTHISETKKEVEDMMNLRGVSPVKYMDSLGALGNEVIAAHCVWLDEEDMEIFARRGVNVVHNINSNLKLASGYKFLYEEMRDMGINIALGTDGAASSNNLDILEAMKTMAMVQKAWREDPKSMPLNELMNVATINGAKALRIDAGRIEEGALADIVLVNTDSYQFTPMFGFEADLVYSANSSCIDTVICDGKILMENRVVPGEKDILEGANEVVKRLLKRIE